MDRGEGMGGEMRKRLKGGREDWGADSSISKQKQGAGKGWRV